MRGAPPSIKLSHYQRFENYAAELMDLLASLKACPNFIKLPDADRHGHGLCSRDLDKQEDFENVVYERDGEMSFDPAKLIQSYEPLMTKHVLPMRG